MRAGMRLRGVLALAALGALLPGCAATMPAPASSASVPVLMPTPAPPSRAGAPALLCNLDSLRWSHGFVARADARDCVGLLESVRIGN